jgi:hypothetical protein
MLEHLVRHPWLFLVLCILPAIGFAIFNFYHPRSVPKELPVWCRFLHEIGLPIFSVLTGLLLFIGLSILSNQQFDSAITERVRLGIACFTFFWSICFSFLMFFSFAMFSEISNSDSPNAAKVQRHILNLYFFTAAKLHYVCVAGQHRSYCTGRWGRGAF